MSWQNKGIIDRMAADHGSYEHAGSESNRGVSLIVEVAEPLSDDQGNPSVRLRPGMFITAMISGHSIDNAFVLPRHLIYGDDAVYTMVDDRLRIKRVRIVRAYRDTVVIDDGLSAGDLIVLTPLSAATEGMKIRVAE